ncbi:unnamed protein product [Caretta caretta]
MDQEVEVPSLLAEETRSRCRRRGTPRDSEEEEWVDVATEEAALKNIREQLQGREKDLHRVLPDLLDATLGSLRAGSPDTDRLHYILENSAEFPRMGHHVAQLALSISEPAKDISRQLREGVYRLYQLLLHQRGLTIHEAEDLWCWDWHRGNRNTARVGEVFGKFFWEGQRKSFLWMAVLAIHGPLLCVSQAGLLLTYSLLREAQQLMGDKELMEELPDNSPPGAILANSLIAVGNLGVLPDLLDATLGSLRAESPDTDRLHYILENSAEFPRMRHHVAQLALSISEPAKDISRQLREGVYRLYQLLLHQRGLTIHEAEDLWCWDWHRGNRNTARVGEVFGKFFWEGQRKSFLWTAVLAIHDPLLCVSQAGLLLTYSLLGEAQQLMGDKSQTSVVIQPSWGINRNENEVGCSEQQGKPRGKVKKRGTPRDDEEEEEWVDVAREEAALENIREQLQD